MRRARRIRGLVGQGAARENGVTYHFLRAMSILQLLQDVGNL